jgi:hypothetical protein
MLVATEVRQSLRKKKTRGKYSEPCSLQVLREFARLKVSKRQRNNNNNNSNKKKKKKKKMKMVPTEAGSRNTIRTM